MHTNRGQEFRYDAILIATGGRPKPPPWPGSGEVSACLGFQTLDDTDAIIEKADASQRVLVMGGSFIGYELAEGVSFRRKTQVTWIMRGPWFLRYVLDEEGGRLCRQLGEEQGVQFITSDEVQKFSRSNGRFTAENYLTLQLYTMPDCVTPGEVIRHHGQGWPRDFLRQLAVLIDVPLARLHLPLRVGGPLFTAAALRVRRTVR